MSEALSRLVESVPFKVSVLVVIVIGSALVGLETYPEFMALHGELVQTLDMIVLSFFLIELVIRLGAYGSSPHKFFKNSWNNFDFIIIVICLLPIHSQYAAVVRLLRVLRVLRLITALPELQLLVGALLKAIPSIGYISVLLILDFYIYACVGTFLFGDNDPYHFGNLHRSMLTLFKIVTLEGWVEIMSIQMYGSDVWHFDYPIKLLAVPQAAPISSAIYFISFILFGTMIVLNLFIGVIMNGMSEMQAEFEAKRRNSKKGKSDGLEGDVLILLRDMEKVQQDMSMIRYRLKNQE